jgi:hypothetical protein
VDVDRAEIDRNKMYNIGGYYYKDGVKNSQVALDTKISNIIKNEKEKEAGPVRKSSIVASNGKKINGKTRV